MSKTSSYEIRVFAEKEKAELMNLVSHTFKMDDEFLVWKYDWNPNFDQSLVIVAANFGKVVGSMIWLPRSLKISKSLEVRAMLGADLAVDRNHRGHGLAKSLIVSENTILEGKNCVMSYGFIDPELVKHVHGPLLGSVEVPTSTTVYKKYLNISEIQEKIENMNKIAKSDEEIMRKLSGLDLIVSFRLKGMPQFMVRISSDGVHLEEEEDIHPDLKVECEITPSKLLMSKRRVLTLVKALLTRKIRIKGSFRDAIRLYGLSELLGVLFT